MNVPIGVVRPGRDGPRRIRMPCRSSRLMPHVATTESTGRSYSRHTTSLSTTKPNRPTSSAARMIASGSGTDALAMIVIAYAPSMMNSPCARLMMPIIPKMMDNPETASTRNEKLSRN